MGHSNFKAIIKPNIKRKTESKLKVLGISTKILPKTKPIMQ